MILRFITFTANPQWPEILAALPPGQTALNRPDITGRIFMVKARELMHDLTKKHVLGKVVGYCGVVEYQKRGSFVVFTFLYFRFLCVLFRHATYAHFIDFGQK